MPKKTKTTEPRWNKEEIMKKHDFQYIRDHFYDKDYSLDDVRGDIYQVYNDNLELSQLSAIGKNTVRVTNYFVMETQYKATSVRAKMSPHRAIQDDDALCEIFNRIDKHTHFFNIRADMEKKLEHEGYTKEILEQDTSNMPELQKEAIESMKKYYQDKINEADLKEVRRAVAHMPVFHRVSQFPNHVAQRIYERYVPKQGGIILDSSCVDGDTEFFTGSQWKKIKDYQYGDKVLQYNSDGTAELVEPLRYINIPGKHKFIESKNRFFMSTLTPDHNVVFSSWDTTNIVGHRPMQDFICQERWTYNCRIPLSFNYNGNISLNDLNITEEELRLLNAIQADGILQQTTTGILSFHLSKERKISRLINLLNTLNIPYAHAVDKNGYGFDKQGIPYKPREVIKFKFPLAYKIFDKTKTFPKQWFNLNEEAKRIIIDEIIYWDGSFFKGQKNPTYYSNNKDNVDFIQFIMESLNYGTSYNIDSRHFDKTGKGSINYSVSLRTTNRGGYTYSKLKEIYLEGKYCFEVPSHMLVLRKNNYVFITGNCGWGNRMMAAMSSKNGYKYLGTDPNSEMHCNYRALADTIYSTIYEDKEPGQGRNYPEDYFDIRDQGSEFDIPEWHNNSGYQIHETPEGTILENIFTGQSTTLPEKLNVPHFEKDIKDENRPVNYHWEHPLTTGKGINDTGKLNTTGAKLPPIMETHNPEIFNSGIGDLSFTSPPYFFLECYTEDSQKGDLSSGQSAGKGANYLQWVKDFMYPTIINHFNYLKPGGYYTYNLKDLPKDGLFLYSDWLSACLDVGFELIEQPEMVLKSKRNFGLNDDGQERIDFRGSTEYVAVLRKPLHPEDPTITKDNKDALYHIQNNFSYPILSICRPKGFKTKLPDYVENWLKEKYKGQHYKGVKKKK